MMKLISDRIGVMFAGNMVELASSNELFSSPLHPYTASLIDAIPIPDPKIEAKKNQQIFNSEGFNTINITEGCVYQNTCPYAKSICLEVKPILLKEIRKKHYAACHLYSFGNEGP